MSCVNEQPQKGRVVLIKKKKGKRGGRLVLTKNAKNCLYHDIVFYAINFKNFLDLCCSFT